MPESRDKRPEDLELLHEIVAARGGFSHREHLELAWAYLGRYPLPEAEDAMTGAIRHIAALHGMPERYHETLTRSWVRLVAVHRSRDDSATFDAFIEGNDGLLERGLLERHFSPDLLWGETARRQDEAPDLRPLPTP